MQDYTEGQAWAWKSNDFLFQDAIVWPRSTFCVYSILYNLCQCHMLQSEPVIHIEHMQMHSLEHLDRKFN